jgi:arylsulfatase A-like enzyme
LLRALVLLWAAGCAPEPVQWNVLVFAPDTIRGDHLSINGYPEQTTPHLDLLARDGVNFRQAITVAPRTWQSFASILTGLYPPRHGVRHVFDEPLAAGTATMATEFERLGYYTVAVDTGTYIREISGGAGFRGFFAVTRQAKTDRLADEIAIERFAAWAGNQSGPFFALVWLPGAHWPYFSEPVRGEDCEGENHAFNGGRYGLEVEGGQLALEDPGAMKNLLWTLDPNEEIARHRVAHYDAELRRTDRLIGHVIGELRRQEKLDTTIIVMTSDHGESFGEHGYMQHGPRVDEPVMHVPLILRLPPTHPRHVSGAVIDEMVRVVDIFPTLLDAVGEPIPEDIDGRSLLPLLDGSERGPRTAYGETGRSFGIVDPERHFEGVAGKHRMIRTAEWKLVHVPTPGGGEDRLYDLRSDPGEMNDVAAAHPRVLAKFRAQLEVLRGLDPVDEPEAELDERQRQNLRALGYAE